MGVVMLSAEIETYLWTWRGRMTLSGCENETFYAEQDLERYVRAVKDVLLRVTKI